MPLADALAICDRVVTWAIARLQLTHDPLYGATASVATDARRALLRLGRERLPRALAERVIDQALHQGDTDPAAVAEAARRVALAHPGALWGPADTVAWERAVVQVPAPAPRPAWATPAGLAERARPRRAESATSLERLVACPLAWALADVAHVRPGRARAIPDVHVVSGKLANALSAAVFVEGPPPSPAAAERRARDLLEDAIDAVAAPLRQSEHAADLTRVRSRLPQAMGALARVLADNRLRVVGTGLRIDFAPEGGPAEVRGFVDLLGRDAAGAAVILDLKWTRTRRHRDDLAQGRAVQLATYVAALQASDAVRPRAGYFRLIQQEYATLRADGLCGLPVDGASLLDTWHDVLRAWRGWTRHAAAGTLLASGVPGCEEQVPDGLEPLRDPACDTCAFRGLCFAGVTA